jgi:hypothetical protein
MKQDEEVTAKEVSSTTAAHMTNDAITTTTVPPSRTSSETPPQPHIAATSSSTRTQEALKQLFCGGLAGSVAKTVTAPFSRLTILFQVHSLVTTKEHRPQFALSMSAGISKMMERGGIQSLWKGNMTSVLHRFPYSAINFFVYENTLDLLSGGSSQKQRQYRHDAAEKTKEEDDYRYEDDDEEEHLTQSKLVRRVTSILGEDEDVDFVTAISKKRRRTAAGTTTTSSSSSSSTNTPISQKFTAGAVAGICAVTACYPLDLVRTRLTTELEGREHYRGILDAILKIHKTEGFRGFYAGIFPTLLVAVPNFAISYSVYGSLKEYMMDDELFYNLRKIDADSGEPKLGFGLTVACGAASGILATVFTFPMDTIRRRMQVQTLHVPEHLRMTSRQQLYHLIHKEGLSSLYRGLTPEIIKVIPQVGTMFVVYEYAKQVMFPYNALDNHNKRNK